MKNSLILSLALFALSTTYADDTLDPAYVTWTAKTPEQQIAVQVKPNLVSPQYDNRFGFSFDRLVYERTKTDSMYFGLDGWAALCFSHSRHHNRVWRSVIEGEARLGYNLFFNGRDHLTPVVGGGYMSNSVGNFRRNARFAYATAGFLYSHEFNTVFGWGVNLKGLAGQQVSQHYEKKFAWGVDLCIPLVFRFGHYRHWDATLEPFYLYMESNHRDQGIFGGRGTVAYRF